MYIRLMYTDFDDFQGFLGLCIYTTCQSIIFLQQITGLCTPTNTNACFFLNYIPSRFLLLSTVQGDQCCFVLFLEREQDLEG